MSDGEVLELESLEGKFIVGGFMAFGCSACELHNDAFETPIDNMLDNVPVIEPNCASQTTITAN